MHSLSIILIYKILNAWPNKCGQINYVVKKDFISRKAGIITMDIVNSLNMYAFEQTSSKYYGQNTIIDAYKLVSVLL